MLEDRLGLVFDLWTIDPAYGQNGVVRTILISDDSLPMMIA